MPNTPEGKKMYTYRLHPFANSRCFENIERRWAQLWVVLREVAFRIAFGSDELCAEIVYLYEL